MRSTKIVLCSAIALLLVTQVTLALEVTNPEQRQPSEWVCKAAHLLADRGCIDHEMSVQFAFPCTVNIDDIYKVISEAQASDIAKSNPAIQRLLLELALEFPYDFELTGFTMRYTVPYGVVRNTGLITELEDIPEESWIYDAVRIMREHGFLKDFPQGTLEPGTSYSRLQFAHYVARMHDEWETRIYEEPMGNSQEDVKLLDTILAALTEEFHLELQALSWGTN